MLAVTQCIWEMFLGRRKCDAVTTTTHNFLSSQKSLDLEFHFLGTWLAVNE